MRLSEYCRRLGWDATELSRQARINYITARKAFNGEAVSGRIARAIADALSKAYGQRINAGDIEGLV